MCFLLGIMHVRSDAAFTVVLLSQAHEPAWVSTLAITFVLAGEFIDELDLASFIYKGDTGSAFNVNGGSDRICETKDQALAAVVLQKTMFLGLHITYQTFLFPVLSTLHTVIFSAAASAVLNILMMTRPLQTMTAESHRGSTAADILSDHIVGVFLKCMVSAVCPFMFAVSRFHSPFSVNPRTHVLK